MALRIFYDKDADLGRLADKTVAVIGYGSQGHAHAQNLKSSGVKVLVGLRKDSPSWLKAERAGLQVATVGEAAREADVVMMTLPDESTADIYREHIEPFLKPGDYLAVAHGFNIHFGAVVAPKDVNVFMVAPKGPGHTVRAHYEQGRGVPSLVAVHADPSGDTLQIALAYAKGIGAGRAGIIETSFREETETDLFGEQAVLCGGLTALMAAGYETLVEAGYSPEMAYFETHPRGEADRRPDLRGRRREHALLDLEHGRVRRPHARAARDRRRNEAAHARDPGRDPDGALRTRVDSREQGRCGLVQGPAQAGRGASDGAGRREAPRADALAQGESPGRPLEELR